MSFSDERLDHEQQIDIDRVGIFELEVEMSDGSIYGYALSSIDYRFSINEIPTATVTLSMTDTDSILAPGSGGANSDVIYRNMEALDLLDEILAARNDESALLACSIYEAISTDDVDEPERQKILDGYIISANVINDAARTSRMIQISCAYNTALLNAAPLTASSFMSPLTLRDAVNNARYGQLSNENIETMVTAAFTSPDKAYFQEGFDLKKEIENLKIPTDCDLAERIGLILDMLLRHSVHQEVGQTATSGFDIAEYFISDYTLSTSLAGKLGKTAKEYNDQFNLEIGKILQDGLLSGSLFSSIMNVITSPDYMLYAAPVFPAFGDEDDEFFGMEIHAVESWDDENIDDFVITETVTPGIECSYSISNCINDPNVFACVFADADMYFGDSNTYNPTSIGIYTRDQKLQDYLTTVTQQIGGSAYDDKYKCRVKMVAAPKWAGQALQLYAEELKAEEDDRRLAEYMQRGTDVSQEELALVKALNDIPLDTQTRQDVADIFAKAVYVTYYGVQDMLQLSVAPSYRFGRKEDVCFEDSIGKLFEIEIYDELHLLGRLISVIFNSTSNGQSSIGYTLHFDTVRPYDDDEEPITNPLYIRLES